MGREEAGLRRELRSGLRQELGQRWGQEVGSEAPTGSPEWRAAARLGTQGFVLHGVRIR